MTWLDRLRGRSARKPEAPPLVTFVVRDRLEEVDNVRLSTAHPEEHVREQARGLFAQCLSMTQVVADLLATGEYQAGEGEPSFVVNLPEHEIMEWDEVGSVVTGRHGQRR